MLRSKLTEGMWQGDLADLVQPLITIDEYESKIDSSAIVIGFYVGDKDAADDLNRFIQKSPVSLIDSDVSPAPDQRGYYIVFVELQFNDRLVPNISLILEEISPLVDVTDWQMKVRNLEGLMAFDAVKLAEVLKANRARDHLKSLKHKIAVLRKKLEKKKNKKKK